MIPAEVLDGETVPAPAGPKTRLERYFLLAATKEDHEWEWSRNPYYGPGEVEALVEAERPSKIRETATTLAGALAMVGGFALFMGAVGYASADPGGSTSTAEERELASMFLTFGVYSAIYPILYLLLNHFFGPKKPERPDFSARFSPLLATAWTDWQEALEGTKALDPDSDAHQALLDQDGTLREALHTYLTDESLPAAQKREFENWFLRTCAEAYELHEAEKERVELYRTYENNNAITLALASSNRLGEAKANSRILSDSVRDALGDSIMETTP